MYARELQLQEHWPLPRQHVHSDMLVLVRFLPLRLPGFAPRDLSALDLLEKLHQQASLIECMKPEILQDCFF